MKKGLCFFIFLNWQLISFSQTEISDISFVAKVKIDWDSGDVSQERFFSILIPANFQYDSTFDFASGYKEGNFYQIRAYDRIDYEEFIEIVMKDGKYDLKKYAKAMTKEHYSSLDSFTVSNVKSEDIVLINGISTLKIRYDLEEIFMGHEISKKCILYLIPMFPKDPASFDIAEEHMIFLEFSCFQGTEDKSLTLFADHIIKTITPLK